MPFTLSQLLAVLLPYLGLLIIQSTPLATFHVPLLGFTTFCYLLSNLILGQKTKLSSSIHSALAIFLVLSIISLTGGTSSHFFFLLYLLSFFLAFSLPAETVVVYAIATVIYFMLLEGRSTDPTHLSLRLISLILLSPLAYFFGKEYRERENIKQDLKDNTEIVTAQINEDVKEVLKSEKLTDSGLEKLNDILEGTQELKNI